VNVEVCVAKGENISKANKVLKREKKTQLFPLGGIIECMKRLISGVLLSDMPYIL